MYASAEYITNASAENVFIQNDTPESHHGTDLSSPKNCEENVLRP